MCIKKAINKFYFISFIILLHRNCANCNFHSISFPFGQWNNIEIDQSNNMFVVTFVALFFCVEHTKKRGS